MYRIEPCMSRKEESEVSLSLIKVMSTLALKCTELNHALKYWVNSNILYLPDVTKSSIPYINSKISLKIISYETVYLILI